MENNEEILARLKFIGLLQKNEKINARFVNKQDANNWYTTISRSIIYPDNRNNTLKFIQNVVNRSFEILENYVQRGNLRDCKTIILDLKSSEKGLANLKHTYVDDTKFCCDIDVIIQKVVSSLEDLEEKHEELKTI